MASIKKAPLPEHKGFIPSWRRGAKAHRSLRHKRTPKLDDTKRIWVSDTEGAGRHNPFQNLDGDTPNDIGALRVNAPMASDKVDRRVNRHQRARLPAAVGSKVLEPANLLPLILSRKIEDLVRRRRQERPIVTETAAEEGRVLLSLLFLLVFVYFILFYFIFFLKGS